jgi:diacylglycerol kinase (ATP)
MHIVSKSTQFKVTVKLFLCLNTTALFVANRKSGNNDGDIILSLFRRLLNPAQVVDLAEHPPEAALEWCSLLGELRASVLVAGGDGTVGWVLNAVNKLQLKVGTNIACLLYCKWFAI